MKKVWIAVLTLVVSVALAGTSFAKKKGYKEGSAGAGSIAGVVTLKGADHLQAIEHRPRNGTRNSSLPGW